MDAGTLNRRVLIQRPVTTQDVGGGMVTTWENFITSIDGKVAANIQYLNGIQTLKSDVPVSVAKASIRIRYRTDIDATCRILYESSIFEVMVALPDAAGRVYLDLACQVGINNG